MTDISFYETDLKTGSQSLTQYIQSKIGTGVNSKSYFVIFDLMFAGPSIYSSKSGLKSIFS